MAPRVKTHARKAKGKSSYVPSSSRDPESEDEGNEDPEKAEEETVEPPPTRRRKLTSEEVLTAKQKKWEDGMAKRNVKNERQVDVASFGAQHQAIWRIVEQGASSEKYRENGRLEPGIINSTVLTKSMSQTRVPRAALGGDYLTSMPPRVAPRPVWYKKMFCHGVAIIESLRKDKKERWEIARKQNWMEHRLEWLTRQAEGSESEPYVLSLVEQAEDSDDIAGDEPVSGDDA